MWSLFLLLCLTTASGHFPFVNKTRLELALNLTHSGSAAKVEAEASPPGDVVTSAQLFEEREAIKAMWRSTSRDPQECPTSLARNPPSMKPAEIKFAQSILAGKSFYVEYGSGASTEWYAPLVNFTVTIENSASWCREIYKRKMMQCLVQHGRLDILCFALSQTLKWAMPSDWSVKNHAENYHMYIRALSFVNFPRYDVILVDGRYRVAVALYALMYIDQKTIVLIHDFNREMYHVVLQYYNKIDLVDTLVALRKKPDLTLDDYHVWRKHLSNPN